MLIICKAIVSQSELGYLRQIIANEDTGVFDLEKRCLRNSSLMAPKFVRSKSISILLLSVTTVVWLVNELYFVKKKPF